VLIEITQYMRPNGTGVVHCLEVDDALKAKYESILSCGCELTCEQLMTEQVSQTISNDYGDFAIEVTAAGDLDAAFTALIKMIKAFDKDVFEAWNATFLEDARPSGLTDAEAEAVTRLPPGTPIGPTGKFPAGKLGPEDQGELAFGIATDKERGLVIMAFGAPVTFLGLYPEQAIAIADALLSKVHELTGGGNGT